jgi:hypothetical protein
VKPPKYRVIVWCDCQKRNLIGMCHTLKEARSLWKGHRKTICKVVEVAL